MVSIFTGLGSGFERGSLAQLGSAGLLGSGALGRSSEQLSLNATTGNLLINQRDEFLVGAGADSGISRTYNSLGNFADDNSDNWRQSTDRRVHGLIGTLNTSGSTVKRVSADGSEVTYSYSTRTVPGGTSVTAYWAADGSGAYDKLTSSSGVWTWTDGNSQATETYEGYGVYGVYGLTGTVNTSGSTISRALPNGTAATYSWDTTTSKYIVSSGTASIDSLTFAAGAWTWSNNGTLVSQTYSDTGASWRITHAANSSGDTLNFTYSGALLDKVSTSDGEYEQYSWSGSNIIQIVTGYTDLATSTAKTLTRTRYGYDGSNRLTSVTVDLSPGDNSVSDGATYVTSYAYDGTSRRIATITETDGSQMAIVYDSSGRVSTLTQTVGGGVASRVTSIAYNTGYTTITDPLSQVTRLDYNSDGSLAKVTSPPASTGAASQVFRYAYDSSGNVLSVTDALGNVTSYTYDSSGNVLTATDPLGNMTTRTYGAQNQLLTETTIDVANSGNLAPDLANAGQWYSTATRVSAGTLDNGAPAYRFTATDNTPTLQAQGLAVTAGDTVTYELTLKAYGSTSAAAAFQVGTGDLSNVTYQVISGPGSFSTPAGGWVELSGLTTDAETRIRITRHVTTTETEYFWLLTGSASSSTLVNQALIMGDASIVKTSLTGVSRTTRYTYDGHDRLEYAISAEGRVTHYSYDSYGNNVSDQVYAGGHYDVSSLSSSTALTSSLVTSWATGTGPADLAVKTLTLNSTRTYDIRGNLTREKSYSSALSTGAEDTTGGYKQTDYLYDQAGQLLSRKVTGLNAENYVYDGLGRIVASIDLNGAKTSFAFLDSATQTVVSHANGLIETTTYDKAGGVLNSTDTLDSTNLGPDLVPNFVYWGGNQTGTDTTPINGKTAYIYTASGGAPTLQSIGTALSTGDTITYELTIKAGTTSDAATIATATGALGTAIYQILSGPGHINSPGVGGLADITGLTSEGTRIRVTYTAPASEVSYLYFLAGASSLTTTQRDGLTIIVGDPSIVKTVPAAPRFQYDARGQLRIATDKTGHTSYFVYDKIGRKVADIDQYGDMTEYTYDADDRVIATVRYANKLTTGSGSQMAMVQDLSTPFDVSAIRPTPNSTTDATINDLRSWKIYDVDGRVIEAIDGTGDVTTYSYDGTGRLTTTIAYATRLSGSQLSAIIAKAPMSLVLPGADAAHDNVSRIFYDKDGLVIGTLDGEGYVTKTDYDDAGHKVAETAFAGQVTNATTRATGTFANLLTTVGTGGSDRITHYAYDDQGQLRFVVDALGNITEYGYRASTAATEIGDVRTVTRYANQLSAIPSSYTVAGIQAVLNPSTTDSDRVSYAVYDSANRLTYAIDASGAVTGYSYDGLGQLIKTTQFATRCTTPSVDPTSMAMWQADSAHVSSNDRVTRSYFDQRGRLKYAVDGEGFLTRYDYDTENRVTGTTRWDNAVSVGDATTTATLVEPATGNHVTTATAYDNDGRVSSTTDGEGWINTFSYNANGTLDYSIRASNSSTDQVKTSYEYDGAGRVKKQYDAAGTADQTVVAYTYDGLGDVVKIVDTLGNSTYNYYDRLGRLTTSRDPENYVTEKAYNAFGEVASVTRRANQATNTADVTTLPVYIASAKDAIAYNYYDNLGRVTLTYDAEHYGTKSHYTSFGEFDTVTRYYTIANNVSSVSVSTKPTFTAHAKDATTSFEYDKLGRLTKTIDAELDHSNNPIYEQYTLNAFGQRTNVRNRLGGVTINTYDHRGLLATEELPISAIKTDGTTEASTVINKFSYDARGNRTTMIEGFGLTEARTTIYKYDKLDRLIETDGDAVPDGTTGVNTVPVSKIAYDARGNVIETIDANGARTLTYYDKLDRPVVKVDALGDYSTIAYSIYAGIGSTQVSRAYATPITLPGTAGGTPPTAPSGAYRESTSTFDKLGRLTKTEVASILTGSWTGTTTSGSYATSVGTLTTSFAYDAAGNVITSTDANGGVVYSYYDRMGHKTDQVDAGLALTSWMFDAEGNVLSETRYAALASSPTTAAPPTVTPNTAADRTTTFTYDRTGHRLTESRANVVAYTVNSSSGALSSPSTVTSTITYSYNQIGQVVAKREANDIATDSTVAYTYDVGGRLINEQRASYTDYNGTTSTPTVQYYYDGLGNLVRTRQSGDPTTTVERITRNTYGAGGRLLSMTDAATTSGVTRSYYYDLAGNKIGESYVRLDSYGTPTTEGLGYKYDKLGRLIQQTFNTVSGTTWTQTGDVTNIAYNAYGEVSKRGTSGSVTPIYQQSFDYDGAGHLWRSNAGDGVWRYYVNDANGNQTLTIESEGTDLYNKTIDQVITIAKNGGGSAIGATYIDGINATVTIYDKRNLTTASIQTQRQVSTAAAPSTVTPTNLIQSRAYNAFGEVLTDTDARMGVTSYTYNTMGRTTSVTHPSATVMSVSGTTGAATPIDTYYYDVSGRLIATQDANGYGTTGNITSRTLLAGTGYGDNQALVVKEFHPDGSVVNAYDAYGDLRKATDGALRDTLMEYDGDGRLKTQTHPGTGGLVDHYEYDVLGQRVYHYNSLLGATNAERIKYDAQGRIVSQKPLGSDETTTTYVWSDSIVTTGMTTSTNAWGGWTQTTSYANGRTSVEVSDALNHVVSKTDMGGHVTNFSFDLGGRVTAATLPASAADSIAYTYLNTGLVSTATTGVYGTSGTYDYRRATYTYDAAGNKLTEELVHNATGISETLQSATAVYDAMGRMTSWTEAGNAMTPAADEAWQYDKVGNIIHLTAHYRALDQDGTASSTNSTQDYYYRYDAMNRVVTSQGVLSGGAILRGTGGVDIFYNGAGDRVQTLSTKAIYYYYGSYNQDTQETYAYSADGTLHTVSVAQNSSTGGTLGAAQLKSTFTYDAMGRLTEQQDWTGDGTGVALDHTLNYNANGHYDYERTISKQGSDTYTSSTVYTFGDVGTSGYALGAVISATTDGLKNDYYLQPNSTTVYSYDWYDGAVQKQIDFTSNHNAPGTTYTNTTTSAYTTTGVLKSAHVADGRTRDVTVTSDGLGQVIRRDEADYNSGGDPHEVWYRFNGKQIGYVGNNGTLDTDYLTSIATRTAGSAGTGAFRNGSSGSVSSANFDQNYSPINSYEQGSSGGIYTVQAGDTLSSIAARVWGDSSLWYKLAQNNGLSATSALTEGQSITLPAGVGTSQNNAGTSKPYNPSDAYGDTSPTTPQPQAAAKNKCGMFGQILLVIIAVAVTIASHGTLTGFAAHLGLSSAAAGIVGGGLAAAAGSIVSQTVGVATGIQDSFSWKGVALAAIGGAVGGALEGVKALQSLSNLTKFGGDVARGALSSAITQGIGVATGLQDKFDWAGVAAAGIGAGVGGAVGRGIHFNPDAKGWDFSNAAKGLVANTVGGLANAATRSLINGNDFGDNLLAALPDIIGNTIGSLVGNGVLSDDAKAGDKANRDLSDERKSTANGSAPGIKSSAEDVPVLGIDGGKYIDKESMSFNDGNGRSIIDSVRALYPDAYYDDARPDGSGLIPAEKLQVFPSDDVRQIIKGVGIAQRILSAGPYVIGGAVVIGGVVIPSNVFSDYSQQIPIVGYSDIRINRNSDTSYVSLEGFVQGEWRGVSSAKYGRMRNSITIDSPMTAEALLGHPIPNTFVTSMDSRGSQIGYGVTTRNQAERDLVDNLRALGGGVRAIQTALSLHRTQEGAKLLPGERVFRDFNQAKAAAYEWLYARGFKPEIPTIGKFGNVGKPVGMQTADGRIGFRVEYDKRSGPHINVFAGKQAAPHFVFVGSQAMVNQIVKRYSK
jgi:YD repeat-containing protein